MERLRRGDRALPTGRLDIEGSRLVRVLSVAQRQFLREVQVQPLGKLTRFGPLGEVRCDRRIVRRRPCKRRGSEAFAGRQRERLPGARAIPPPATGTAGARHDGHVVIVLRRRAYHRGPANVDVLDDLLVVVGQPCCRRLEGVKIADHEINGRDVLFLEGAVLGVVPDGEKAAVNARVQRLHAPV